MTRYPHVRVELRTPNPLALVAAVRHALRRAGVDGREIRRFTAEAMTGGDPAAARRACDRWVDTGRRG